MDEESLNKSLFIGNQINELTRVAFFLEEIGEEWGLPMSLILSLNLVLEEALTNIISYGYDDIEEHSIEIIFTKTRNEFIICIADDGHEYDPTSKSDPDITLSAEDRPIGGLGIFLIKKIMEKVEYQRKNNKNYFILTKHLES
jgi:anti-sigma regulatory factor (Ser/Thr protein kinase)